MYHTTARPESHGVDHSLLKLQRTAGNQAVAGLVGPQAVQRWGVKDLIATFESIAEKASGVYETARADTLKNPEAFFKARAAYFTASSMLGWAQHAGVKLHRRLEVAFKLFSPTYADIDSTVLSATQAERDKVANDDAMLGKINGVVTADQYLTMLTHLRIFRTGTTAEDTKTHTKASEADKLIRSKLGTYVAGAVKAGRKIEGQVGVVDDSGWNAAGEAHYGKTVWNKGPKGDGVNAKKDLINGFVDGKGRVWIHKDRGNAGTMIHEAMHKYSSSTMYMNQMFNEGNTEYFTRKITVPLGITRGNYDGNHRVATKLASVVGEATLAKGYFDGDKVAVEKALNTKDKTDGAARLKKVADLMGKKQWSSAKKSLG